MTDQATAEQERTWGRCVVPPSGWHCTRAPGHEGPCAAISTIELVSNALRTARRAILRQEDTFKAESEITRALWYIKYLEEPAQSAAPRPEVSDDVVERVAAAMKPNLFRLYPGGQSRAHYETRQMARAAIAALTPVEGEGL